MGRKYILLVIACLLSGGLVQVKANGDGNAASVGASTEASRHSSLKGYRGYYDISYALTCDKLDYTLYGLFTPDEKYYDSKRAHHLQLSTTHGYQFNNYFFLGIGAALSYYTDKGYLTVPVFLDIHTNVSDRKVSPYIDLRIGYSFSSNVIDGLYFSPGAGVRIRLCGGKHHMDCGLLYETIWGEDCGLLQPRNPFKSLGLKVGYEF